ncbi:MAG TPA: cytochrome D1 domain-containing protein [Mycobacterium sp.]|nr:cytochrome D1 domain-containing protein [Mycobacterium sp.]
MSLLIGGSLAARAALAAERLYVSDETGGNVVIVDPQQQQVVARIAVGKRPRGIQISPDHRKVYVALSGSPIAGPNVDESKLPPPDRRYDGIGVVDLASQKLIHTYQSGADPETFALSHDGKMLYVSNEDVGQMSAVDLTTGKVRATVAVGSEPEGVAVSADDRIVYVTCETANSIYVVDAGSMKVRAQIPTGKRPRAIYLASESQRGYATDEFAAALTVFDTREFKALTTITLGDPGAVRPMGIASTDGRKLYVTTGRFGALLEVDPQAARVVRTVDKVGQRPWGLALSRDGAKAYTANGPSGDVSVIDVPSGHLEARIPVGGSPWGIVAAPWSAVADAKPQRPAEGGIWKAAVPAQGTMHGEFDNNDPIGLTAGDRIQADCSINWVDPDTGQLYCFASATSLVVFLDAPRAYLERARLQWQRLERTG